jgi:hypothetical protein
MTTDPKAATKAITIRATAETLHIVAGWVHIPAKDLHEIADRVAAGNVADWYCCPVCTVKWCNDNCPLAPVRAGVLEALYGEERPDDH